MIGADGLAPTAEALFAAEGGKLGVLAALSLAAYRDDGLPDGLAALQVAGLEGGSFVDGDGVAVALVGRSADSLFVAFRGTDDPTDRSEWLRTDQHFARFAPLIVDLDAYLNTANDVVRVYLTGHSLGGAMAQASMERWAGDRFEAITFASPGFGLGRPDADDARIGNVWLSGDPVLLIVGLSGVRGDRYLIRDVDPDGADLGLAESHDPSTYVAIARSLDSHGLVPEPALAANGRIDEAIVVPVAIERPSDGPDVLSVRIVDDPSLADLFGQSGAGTAATPRGLIFVGRVAGRSSAVPPDDVFAGGQGADTLLGADGGDRLFGAGGADLIRGDSDSDLVAGDEGDDWHLNGNAGADTVRGGTGADTVHGGRGDDAIHGDAGDDVLSGDLGDDTIAGGPGADRFLFAGGSGRDLVLDLDPAAGDRIVLLPDVGIPDAASALSRIVAGAEGDAVLDLGDGDRVFFAGIRSDAIGPELFLFV